MFQACLPDSFHPKPQYLRVLNTAWIQGKKLHCCWSGQKTGSCLGGISIHAPWTLFPGLEQQASQGLVYVTLMGQSRVPLTVLLLNHVMLLMGARMEGSGFGLWVADRGSVLNGICTEEAVGHTRQPASCSAQKDHLLLWASNCCQSPGWPDSRHKSFPCLVLASDSAVTDPDFLALSNVLSGSLHGLSFSLKLCGTGSTSHESCHSVRWARLCTAVSPAQWPELPAKAEVCWVQRELLAACCSCCPGGGQPASACRSESARVSLFVLNTTAFCFTIWRRVPFPEIFPVILEITHSRALWACLQTGIWGARPTLCKWLHC